MYYITWIFTRLIALVPTSGLEGLSRLLAVTTFDILRVRRDLILKNIEIAFPDYSIKERRRVGRASIYHFVATALETLVGGPTDMLAGVTFRNPQIMDQAMSQGRGVYLLCIHSGNFEVLGAAASTRWRPVTVPVKFVGRGGFDRYVHEQRQRYKILPVRNLKKGDGYKAICEALSEARPVGFMLDQARPGEPRLPLFGRPAKTNTSLAAIWHKNPAPLIPLMVKRTSFGVHVVNFYPEVNLTCSGDAQQDVISHSIQFNLVVEMMVKECPEQYWWIHNRWK